MDTLPFFGGHVLDTLVLDTLWTRYGHVLDTEPILPQRGDRVSKINEISGYVMDTFWTRGPFCRRGEQLLRASTLDTVWTRMLLRMRRGEYSPFSHSRGEDQGLLYYINGYGRLN
jgi:hypothetical protein